MTTLSSIQATSREILHHLHFVALQEKNPVAALFENKSYAPLKEKLEGLGRTIEALDGKKSIDVNIQSLWKTLFCPQKSPRLTTLVQGLSQIEAEASGNPLTLPLPPFSPFASTDLVIFKDNFRGELPSNGVRESDYFELLHLYEKIDQGKTNIRFSGAQKDREKVMRNLAVLLTRPRGRELLFDVASRKNRGHQIAIEIGSKSQVIRDSNGIYRMMLSLDKAPLISEWPDGTKRSELVPKWITLAHELIHIRHHLNGTYQRMKSDLYTTIEEMRTITGKCPGSVHDPVNENAIRKEFGLHPRWSHKRGIFTQDEALTQIKAALKWNSMEEVRAIALRFQNSSAKLRKCLFYALSKQRKDAFEILYEVFRNSAETPFKQKEMKKLLLSAAEELHAPLLRYLLEKKEVRDFLDLHKVPLLQQACHDIEKIRVLLDMGFDPDERDGKGDTALACIGQMHWCGSEKKCRAIKLLIDAGARSIPESALIIAAEALDWPLTRRLAHLSHLPIAEKSAASVQDPLEEYPEHLTDNALRLALFDALEEPALLTKLLQECKRRHLSLDVYDHEGTALLTKAAHPHIAVEVFEQLLLQGADPNIADLKTRKPPLFAACMHSGEKVALLLANGADPMPKDVSDRPLSFPSISPAAADQLAAYAIENGDKPLELPTRFAEVLRQRFQLDLCSEESCYKMMKRHVINNKDYPHLKQWMTEALLRVALQKGYLSVARKLFERGAHRLKGVEELVAKSAHPEQFQLARYRNPPPPAAPSNYGCLKRMKNCFSPKIRRG